MPSTGAIITFWGTRGSISTPGGLTEKYGGNTPCVSVEYGNTVIILDSGTGIRNLGLHLAERPKEAGPLDMHIFLTHTHWDHIQGLPFFGPAYVAGNKLAIYGSRRKEIFLESILRRQMDENYFPVPMTSFNANIMIREIADRRPIEIGPLRVEWMDQPSHPGGSVHYKICVGDKRAVYATDVELDQIFGPDPQNPTSPDLAAEYRSFVNGVDVLIADGQYTEDEYPSKKGWGHTAIPTLLGAVAGQKVKQLAVFHHDPQHSDAILDNFTSTYSPRYLEQNPGSKIFWAREGMTIPL